LTVDIRPLDPYYEALLKAAELRAMKQAVKEVEP
jgi:hypothetical protein